MTAEEDFQAQLDLDPDDHQTRLVFADWLQERDDPRAEGYRALGTLRKRPMRDDRPRLHNNWYYHCGRGNIEATYPEFAQDRNQLPEVWIRAISTAFGEPNSVFWVGYWPDRKKVEDMAAMAFANIRWDLMAEILAAEASV